jgi:competence protein ComEC
MSSKKQKPFLIVLDVGHGNAAVLHDEGGTVVFDTGKGAHVGRYLNRASIRKIQAMFLSHADEDHIGGAVTLLLDPGLRIGEVFINSDSSKNTLVFEQLCLALADANCRRGTKIDRRLTISTKLRRKGTYIEVLHPPDLTALSGVGGKSNSGVRQNSNSMSAAIRLSRNGKTSILLGGDIEYDCVDDWKKKKIQPTAPVLVFPHHGGLPGVTNEKEAQLFAYEITKLVNPEVVIFSNHRTKHGNPLDCVLKAVAKAASGVYFACTQLPQRLQSQVKATGSWSLHKPAKGAGVLEGSICLTFKASGVKVAFGEKP